MGWNYKWCVDCVNIMHLIQDLSTGQHYTNILVWLFIKEFGSCKLWDFPGRNNKLGGDREIGLKTWETREKRECWLVWFKMIIWSNGKFGWFKWIGSLRWFMWMNRFRKKIFSDSSLYIFSHGDLGVSVVFGYKYTFLGLTP